MDDIDLDIDAIRKGDIVSDATIRRIIGEQDDPIRFLQLRHFWAESLKTALYRAGKLYTVRWVGDELHVLTDAAASEYNARQFGLARRKQRRRHELIQAVDRSNLDRKQKAEHDRAVVVQAAIIAASDRAARQVATVVTQRTTPVVRHPAPRREVLPAAPRII